MVSTGMVDTICIMSSGDVILRLFILSMTSLNSLRASAEDVG